MQNLELLFQQLLHYRDQSADLSTLGPWLQRQVAVCSFPAPCHVAFEAATYTRNCVAKENASQGFEALIMRWDQQVKTRIHGHPAFSFYYVISGMFEMEYFVRTQRGLRLKGTQRFLPCDTTWFLGEAGRYDNFIHRVTCLKPGLTFHVYSDDAQKGLTL